MRVEQSGQETTVAKIGDTINNTIDFKSSSELKGEQWANAYNLPLMGPAFYPQIILQSPPSGEPPTGHLRRCALLKGR